MVANREIRVSGKPKWHSRGYLPHLEHSEFIQHVTFHLADSLPQSTLQRLQFELNAVPTERRDVERRKQIDSYLDAGYGSCILRRPEIADSTQASLLYFDSTRYRLLAWAVMPNHVHVLFQPQEPWTVASVVATWKKFIAKTVHDLRRQLGDPSAGPVWHREYWDRFIRDERHLGQAIEYIELNPVKARLVSRAEEWPWSSAFARNLDRGA